MKHALRPILSLLPALALFSGCLSRTDTDFPSRQESSECLFAWSALETWYVFEEEVPSDPLAYLVPESLYATVSDPWTLYVSPGDAERFLSFFSSGNASGCGVFISTRFDTTYFIHFVVSGSPAQRAGLRKADTLVTINDVRATGLSPDSLFGLISGPEGGAVRFEIKRDSAVLSPITVIRGTYLAPTVFADTMENSIPYLAILEFFDSTVAGIRATADEFRTLLGGFSGTTPVILDLRGNPGGLIDQCLEVCDALLPMGTPIVRSRYKSVDESSGKSTLTDTLFRATGGDLLGSRELIVLTDGHTASAAEIVTAGLKNRGAGVFVMGDSTYGKARGQILLGTLSGGVAKITCMTLSTAGNLDYNGTGIAPDTLLGQDVEWLNYAWRRASLQAGLPVPKASASVRGLKSKANEINFNRRLMGLTGRERFRLIP